MERSKSHGIAAAVESPSVLEPDVPVNVHVAKVKRSLVFEIFSPLIRDTMYLYSYWIVC